MFALSENSMYNEKVDYLQKGIVLVDARKRINAWQSEEV